MKNNYFFLSLSFLSLLVSLERTTAQIPIIVEENKGFQRVDEPVTLGVPFAKGQLNSIAGLSLQNPGGTTVNAQFKTMANWNDGSIKWVKCDFQANVNANSIAQYALQTNQPFTSNTALTATENASSITVTTGPLRFIISKIAFNLIDQAWLDLNNDGLFTSNEEIISAGNSIGPNVMAGANTYSASAAAPRNISIEEQGPMKVVIKVDGLHYLGNDSLLKYETRIYAYAGQPYIKLWHVYANGITSSSLGDSGDPFFGAAFDSYKIDLKLNLTGTKTAQFGGQNGTGVSFTIGSGQTSSLIQSDRIGTGTPLAYTIMNGATQQGTGAKADGWGDLSDSQWGMMISSKYFWQKYPKGIELMDNGTVSFQPAPSPEFLWMGMGTGDEILLYFHNAAQATQAQNIAMRFSKNPLFPHTSPQQYISSYAFYDLCEGPTPYPAMDNYTNQTTTNHLNAFESLQLYGNIHYGDMPRGEFEVNNSDISGSTWGNNYYDAMLTAMRLFAQSGDLKYVDIFQPQNWHQRETACFNSYDDNNWLYGFSGSYGPDHRNVGHFEQHYGEGLWYYYYLTGDERSREIGLRAANSIVYQQPWGNENVNCRLAYQRGSACIEAYKNTGDTIFLNHAKHLLVDKILATQDTFGRIGSVDFDNNLIWGEQVFMTGLYSDALWKYIQENPQPQYIQKFKLLADFIDIYARKIPGQEEYWNWFAAPNNATYPIPEDTTNMDATVYWTGKGLIAGTYAYAYYFTGNTYYRTLAENIISDMWNGIGAEGQEFWGKASAQTYKNLIHAICIISNPSLAVTNNSNPDVLDICVFPNPANGKIFIRYDMKYKVEAKIFNSLGELIYFQPLNQALTCIEIQTPGIYFLYIPTYQKSYKFIITR